MAKLSVRVTALHGLLLLVRAQTSPSGTEAANESPSTDTDREHCISPGNCISSRNGLVVNALSPPGGPLDGSTRVVIIGHGFRNFGSLMRCRFGPREVTSRLYVEPGTVANPYNHTMVQCDAPQSPTPLEQTVPVEVSLNGQDYSSSGHVFTYYRHPSLVAVSPQKGSASIMQTLTLTRSTAVMSGGWSPISHTPRTCRFKAVVLPEGKRQVQFVGYANASVADETELQCASPSVNFTAPVHIEVTLNGQQYSSAGPVFTYEDNWHSPATSGHPPSGRLGTASAIVGSLAYYFGGENGQFHDSAEGFVGDFWALHTDAMSDFYPSDSARDLAWQKLSLSTSGDTPTPRSYASLVAWSTNLILFGGTSTVHALPHKPHALSRTHRTCPSPQATRPLTHPPHGSSS